MRLNTNLGNDGKACIAADERLEPEADNLCVAQFFHDKRLYVKVPEQSIKLIFWIGYWNLELTMPLEKDVERIAFLDAFEELAESNFEKYVDSYKQRILCAARDVFGKESPELAFFFSVVTTGKPDVVSFKQTQLSTPSLIHTDGGKRLGSSIVGYLRNVYRGETDFICDDNLYGLWEDLEIAGMSHENIGKYFERFDEEQDI